MEMAQGYIDAVQSGEQLVGRWIKLAVERHVNDLATSESDQEFPFYFDEEEATRAVEFVKLCKHTTGKWMGLPFHLLPWQAFIISSIFGWKKRKNNKRRYDRAYIRVARKNGKTELMAALALYALVMDGEKGGQVYFAATKKDQAKVGFNATKIMLSYLRQDSVTVRQEFNYNSHTIYSEHWHSFCKAMGRDTKGEDGLSPHVCIIDEYHAHQTDEMVNVMESGMGGREQPLMLIITTAGYFIHGPCKNFEDTAATAILEGSLDDPSTFVAIYTLDPEDIEDPESGGVPGWHDEKVWVKANPGISNDTPSLDYLRGRFRKAVNEGGEKETDFLTKNMNVWTRAKKTWVQDKYYLNCVKPRKLESLAGLDVYLGLDLAKTRDITALSMLFPVQKGLDKPFMADFFWVPEENQRERQKDDKVPYVKWAKGGHIITTEGNVVDQDQIELDILKLVTPFNVRGMAFDPWNAEQITQHLDKQGIKRFEFRQYTTLFNEPLTLFERWILTGECEWNLNPVTRWMLGNVAIYRDKNDNRKVDRDLSQEKVDGIVTRLMAVGLWLKFKEKESIYKNRDMIKV